MHRIDPAAMTPPQARLVWRHLSNIRDVTPESKLADLFGQPRDRYHLECPSDRTHPGEPWQMRVKWTEAGVWAGHYGHLCPRAEFGQPCWHAYGAVLRIALQFYDGLVPVAAPDAPGATAAPAASPPPPARPVSVGGDWWA